MVRWMAQMERTSVKPESIGMAAEGRAGRAGSTNALGGAASAFAFAQQPRQVPRGPDFPLVARHSTPQRSPGAPPLLPPRLIHRRSRPWLPLLPAMAPPRAPAGGTSTPAERKNAAVWELIHLDNYKQALALCNRRIKKGEKSEYLLVRLCPPQRHPH